MVTVVWQESSELATEIMDTDLELRPGFSLSDLGDLFKLLSESEKPGLSGTYETVVYQNKHPACLPRKTHQSS